MYSTDLAYIHESGFGAFAREVAPEIVAILRRTRIRSGLVVEIGCGGGTLARHLVEKGYRVRGYDISPAMIRLARARAPRAEFRVASLADAPLPACAAIVSIGEVVADRGGGPQPEGYPDAVNQAFAVAIRMHRIRGAGSGVAATSTEH